jgi:lambda repressor-like predicted transcriptional regulator
VLSEEKQRHVHIRHALYLKGITLADIARSLNISQGSVSQVSVGRSRSKRVEKALASALNTTTEQLFPDRYSKKEGEL